MLKSDREFDLFYDINHKNFHTKVSYKFIIYNSKSKQNYSLSDEFLLQFYIKQNAEGYEIGIITPESIRNINFNDGHLIKITTLPYGLFHLPKYKLGVLKPEKLTSLLNKNGWTLEKNDFEETSSFPQTAEHKYFTVCYEEI